jgi:hypothetical protein
MPNFHFPVIVERATPLFRAILLECERRRQALGWPMWKLDAAAGTQCGHHAKCQHADRPSGRQGQWKTLHLIVSALWPRGFDLEITHKPGGILWAEDHWLKVKFAAADHDRLSRRALMSYLGKRGAAARMKKLGKREPQIIAKRASKAAAVKRSERAAARAQTQSGAVT